MTDEELLELQNEREQAEKTGINQRETDGGKMGELYSGNEGSPQTSTSKTNESQPDIRE